MYCKHLVRLTIIPVAIAIATVPLWSSPAQAVPSFARQTGMSCAACHTVAPQLTAFGRYFKLHGYVLVLQRYICTCREHPGPHELVR